MSRKEPTSFLRNCSTPGFNDLVYTKIVHGAETQDTFGRKTRTHAGYERGARGPELSGYNAARERLIERITECRGREGA